MHFISTPATSLSPSQLLQSLTPSLARYFYSINDYSSHKIRYIYSRSYPSEFWVDLKYFSIDWSLFLGLQFIRSSCSSFNYSQQTSQFFPLLACLILYFFPAFCSKTRFACFFNYFHNDQLVTQSPYLYSQVYLHNSLSDHFFLGQIVSFLSSPNKFLQHVLRR